MPRNFGAVLDAMNIELSLAAWREERDSWIVQHPDSVERMRKAEDNLRQRDFLQGGHRCGNGSRWLVVFCHVTRSGSMKLPSASSVSGFADPICRLCNAFWVRIG